MSVGEADFGLEISKGVLAKFVMAIIGFVGSVIFARKLGPAGYGAFYIVLSVINVFDNPVTGWGMACKKRISEAEFPTDEALGSGLIGAAFFPLIVLPSIYFLHLHTEMYDLSGLFTSLSVLFVAICFFVVTNSILSARSNFSAAEWADTLRSLLTTPIQLALVLLGLGTTGMVYGLAIATALTVPFVLWKISVLPAVPSRKSIVRISTFAKYSIPNGFLSTALSRMDILLLGALLSPAAVGEYQIALQLTMPATFIGDVTAAGLMARVSENWSKDNKAAINTDVTNSLGFASVLAIPIFFGAAAMPDTLLVTVFGSKYEGIGLVLISLALFRVVNMQSTQLGSTMAGLDRPDIGTRVSVVVLVLNIGLGYFFLLQFGIIGVVVATVIAELVKYIVVAYVVKQHLPNLSLLNRPLIHQLLAGGVMFIVIDRLNALIVVSWWGELLSLIGVGGIIYFTVLTATSESFNATVQGVFSDALSR